MLLGNTDVEETKFHALSEVGKTGARHHAGTDRHKILVSLATGDDAFGELIRKCLFAGRLNAFFPVKRTYAVVRRWIFFGELIAFTFFSRNVDKDRTFYLFGDLQLLFEKFDVMAVKWSEILKSQILENDRFAVAADQKTDPGLDRN